MMSHCQTIEPVQRCWLLTVRGAPCEGCPTHLAANLQSDRNIQPRPPEGNERETKTSIARPCHGTGPLCRKPEKCGILSCNDLLQHAVIERRHRPAISLHKRGQGGQNLPATLLQHGKSLLAVLSEIQQEIGGYVNLARISHGNHAQTAGHMQQSTTTTQSMCFGQTAHLLLAVSM
jgi:hypothetical protein